MKKDTLQLMSQKHKDLKRQLWIIIRQQIGKTKKIRSILGNMKPTKTESWRKRNSEQNNIWKENESVIKTSQQRKPSSKWLYVINSSIKLREKHRKNNYYADILLWGSGIAFQALNIYFHSIPNLFLLHAQICFVVRKDLIDSLFITEEQIMYFPTKENLVKKETISNPKYFLVAMDLDQQISYCQ